MNIFQHFVGIEEPSGSEAEALCGRSVTVNPFGQLPPLVRMALSTFAPTCPRCQRIIFEHRVHAGKVIHDLTADAAAMSEAILELLHLVDNEGTFEMHEQAVRISEEARAKMPGMAKVKVEDVQTFDDLPDVVKDALMKFVTGIDQS